MEAKDKPKTLAAATNQELLNKALQAGAEVSPTGSPIVGTAGLILGLSHMKNIDALCLLGETRGYLPDPKSAKSVLEVLQSMFGFDASLAGLDEDIAKAEKMVSRLQRIEEKEPWKPRKLGRKRTRKSPTFLRSHEKNCSLTI